MPAAPKTPPKAAGPGLTDQPVVDLPRSVLLYNPDTFGRCNFRVEDSQRIDGKIIIYDFRNVLDRFFVSERAGRRATQHRIPYPNNAPELLADIQSLETGASCRSRSRSADCHLLPYRGEFQGHRKLGFGHPQEYSDTVSWRTPSRFGAAWKAGHLSSLIPATGISDYRR